jgi:hypothetical protein
MIGQPFLKKAGHLGADIRSNESRKDLFDRQWSALLNSENVRYAHATGGRRLIAGYDLGLQCCVFDSRMMLVATGHGDSAPAITSDTVLGPNISPTSWLN